jgi:TolB-like protein/lipoprotein NlpI
MLYLRALGTPSLEVGGSPARGAGGQRKPLALLSLLAVAGERGLSRDRLMAYLWPEGAADRAGHRLTQLLYSIRRDLRADGLFTGTTDLRLNPELLDSDVARFADALAHGDYVAAVAVYGGPFLDGFFLDDAPEFERWVEVERTRLARRQAESLEALALAAERAGDASAAAEWWRRRVDSEPSNGRVVVRCMNALAALGEAAEALRLARAHEVLMREELEAPADPEVIAAVQRLRSERTAAEPSRGAAQSAADTAIAVLPFINLTPGREGEYFSDGLTEELINALAGVPGLQVAAASSSFAFKNKPLDARAIGEQLGVGSLVEGSVRMVGRRIRLSVQLVSTADGYQRWSDTYERTIDDVLALQEELARAVVTALPLPGRGTLPPAAVATTRDPEAYTLYLRGRYAALKRTEEGFALGIEYFEQATERDPSYALAHAALAECWLLRGFPEYGGVPALTAMPKARAAALQAQRLDPTLAEPHLWLGAVRLLFDWDLPGAEAALRRALELGPRLAFARTWYALYLAVVRRFGDALHYAREAQALEPLSLNMQLVIGRILYWSGRLDEAQELLQAMRLADPGHPLVTMWLARVLALSGRPADGVAVLKEIPERARGTYVLSLEARLLVMLGEGARARALCEAAEAEPALGGPYLAAIRLALGETERAVALLEQLLSQRSALLVFCALDGLYAELLQDPRTASVLRRVGVPLE